MSMCADSTWFLSLRRSVAISEQRGLAGAISLNHFCQTFWSRLLLEIMILPSVL